MSKEAALERQLARQRAARQEAEALLEAKAAELFESNRRLSDTHAGLERAVAARTMELVQTNTQLEAEVQRRAEYETRLQLALESAEEATKAKDQFMANMSHEMRTPMNGVIGMCQLLVRTELDDKQQRYAETALTSARALLRVIDDVLDISKIEAGMLSLVDQAFDPEVPVREVEAMLLATAMEKGITVKTTIKTPPGIHLVGDSDRIRQVIANLGANAVKFTSAGRVTLDLLVERCETGYRYTVQVTDSGIGISSDQLEVIFEPFVQADSSMARSYGGTGLGLAISKRLVEQMGGTIGVVSEVGTGTTFSMSIPLAVAYTPTPAPTPAKIMIERTP